MKQLLDVKRFVVMDLTMASINAMMETSLMEMDAILSARLSLALVVHQETDSHQVCALIVKILQPRFHLSTQLILFISHSMKKLFCKEH